MNMNKKRIAAVIGLVLIGLLYVSVLILAFIDSSFARSCLMAALFGTIVIPAVIYGYMVFAGRRDERKDGEEGEDGGV